MRSKPSGLRSAPTPLTSYSFGQVLVASLAAVAAIAGTVFLIANPTLAVGFVVGLATARARHRASSLLERVDWRSADVDGHRTPASE